MKKTISLVLILIFCLSLSSCFTNYDEYSVARAANKQSYSYSDLLEENYKGFLEKLEKFAAKLSEEIYDEVGENTNFCISPISVYMALALTVESSAGETRSEILDAVGVSYDEVNSFTKMLYFSANREYKYTNLLDQKRVLAFQELANSIWADNSVPLEEGGIYKLANDYHADLFKVSFESGKTDKIIGKYISEKTHGLIDGDINFSPETLITLINTYYLKEVWTNDGDELPFTDKTYDFKNSDGSIEATKLLQGFYNKGRVYEAEDFSSFFTTTENGFKIRFIVPNGENTVEDVFTAENLYLINNLADYGYVDDENRVLHNTRVLFPEFDASFDEDISEILKEEFGIEKLFSRTKCDLSNLSSEPLYCNQVIHKCALEVTDKGIEGAAVTIMALDGAAGPPIEEYENVFHDFTVDRAFGFIITDSYDTVVFSGVINKI